MSTNQSTSDVSVQILQDVVLFDYIIGGSTGEKTVEADDFIREVGKTLPSGTFAWVNKYRAEAKREILKVGVSRRVNNRVRGYFVPTAHAQGLAQVLKQIRDKYLTEKKTFLAELPAKVEEWAKAPENVGVSKPGGRTRAELIRIHAPQQGVLEKMLTFDISAIRINDTNYFGEDDALQQEVKGLVGQAAFEISEDVRRSWSGPKKGNTTSRVLGLVRRVQDKAEAMSVLSSKFGNLAKLCGEVLAAVPTGQNIEGVAFIQVSSLLQFCMDPEKIIGDQATEFDPLVVTDPTVTTESGNYNNVFFGEPEAANPATPNSAPNAPKPETGVSIVPPLPTDREAHANIFFDEKHDAVAIGPATAVTEPEHLETVQPFIF
ncbi:hypothetical protein PVE_P0337 (plasmid) [Pseudomonas veronii 1YdBTEX2]|uniref:DUF3150 domain-containing protein n=2 Tax=Pseudomonas veronii TaxID=76761 RepID=A0ABS0VQW6_PSEVE|nr:MULTISPECIES: DUF3150 domain-containing protein [Pseudomonas]SBW85375.1 hypothetical protein PVE_P0337 [Pseudomonas veronii 1YdBTEX2]KAA0945288.1 DUF3150 domain-containing protein [Pseudomonas sp. ANT_H14]KAA0946323.1 DUF3150 domain-containing protein [Pseudomonas sp. ANT_H4]MBI6556450.1 DUF3150 domain-containing protein [Pseudomonas veronii]MBI6653916.1 DUF3150 domain-containing protein [Pseudomonas veronii]